MATAMQTSKERIGLERSGDDAACQPDGLGAGGVSPTSAGYGGGGGHDGQLELLYLTLLL